MINENKALFCLKSWTYIVIFALILMILAVIEEAFFLNSLVPCLLGALGFEILLIAITAMLALIANNEKITRLRGDHDSFVQDVLRVFNEVVYILRKCTFVGALTLVMIALYAPAAMAQYRLTARIGAFIEEGIDIAKGVDAFFNYKPETKEYSTKSENDIPSQSVETVYDNRQATLQQANTNSLAGINPAESVTDDKEWFVDHPASEQNFAKRLIISESEKELVYTLSEEEYTELFFLNGEYQIVDWSNNDLIYEQVKYWINDLKAEEQENIFDSENGAPESLKTDINDANEKDENATELKAKKDIIALRNNAYQLYPKYSLANLIAESYNGIGLAYYWQCQNREQAKYYFGQAILWHYKSLTFKDNSPDTNRDILNSIKQRYKDIVFVSSSDSLEAIFSSKLIIAFERILSE